jgi:hypothetical protein
MDKILEFFDDSVADGSLTGSGPGKSANGRLNALRNMLEMAAEFIFVGDIEDACGQLEACLKNATESLNLLNLLEDHQHQT